MKKNLLLLLAIIKLTTVGAQTFNHSYNGTSLKYQIVSVPDHEVVVVSAPSNCVNVSIPSTVLCNGESFKVVGICGCLYGNGAFKNCKYLKSVTLPQTIEYIGENAFYGCSWLRTINLPKNLLLIDDNAFNGCESLTTVTLPSSLVKIGSYAFYNTRLKNISIPESIREIKYDAFSCKTLSSIKLPFSSGFTCGKLLILTNPYIDVSSSAFPSLFDEVWSASDFRKKVVDSTGFVIFLMKKTKISKKDQEELIIPILLTSGLYEEAYNYFPDNENVLHYKKYAEYQQYINQGHLYMRDGLFTEAQNSYQQASFILPDSSYYSFVDKCIAWAEDSISAQQERKNEAERQRIEAEKKEEEKKRRNIEESNVRSVVDANSRMANRKIHQNQLQEAVVLLQQALDTAQAHNYTYRQSELVMRIDSIQQLRALFADTSIIFDYKIYQPDQYDTIDRNLANRIKSFLIDRGKNMEQNNMSLTLYTKNHEGSFLLEKSSRTLKKLCKQLLYTEILPPFVIDGHEISSSATFNYTFEYARGTVKVQQSDGISKITPKYDISPQLWSDLNQIMTTKLNSLSDSFNGSYKYSVSSFVINGQMEHSVELKSCSFENGPQNAWRSLLIPFWGDKYVKGGIMKETSIWWVGTWLCYSAIGAGIYGLLNEEKEYDIYSDSYKYKNRTNYITMIAAGGAIWLSDVIAVWIKGAKNKKENKARLSRISFTYNAAFDTPELMYSLYF